jgi:hypothetical protein
MTTIIQTNSMLFFSGFEVVVVFRVVVLVDFGVISFEDSFVLVEDTILGIVDVVAVEEREVVVVDVVVVDVVVVLSTRSYGKMYDA